MYPVKSHTPENSIALLPPSDVEQVKASEMKDPNRLKPNWTCAHCTVHFDNLKLSNIVVEHLKSAYVLSHFYPRSLIIHPILSRHGIHSPREPEDLFIFARKEYHQPFEARYWVEPSKKVKTIRYTNFFL